MSTIVTFCPQSSLTTTNSAIPKYSLDYWRFLIGISPGEILSSFYFPALPPRHTGAAPPTGHDRFPPNFFQFIINRSLYSLLRCQRRWNRHQVRCHLLQLTTCMTNQWAVSASFWSYLLLLPTVHRRNKPRSLRDILSQNTWRDTEQLARQCSASYSPWRVFFTVLFWSPDNRSSPYWVSGCVLITYRNLTVQARQRTRTFP